jgi:gag-polypeptide of LTR copia-type
VFCKLLSTTGSRCKIVLFVVPIVLFIALPRQQKLVSEHGFDLMTEASNNATVSMSNPTIPMFKGENYEFWSINMRTMLKSHGLWDLADKGIPNPDLAPIDSARRDAKALFFIQQAVHESVFSKIAAAETTNKAWTTLKTAFQGSFKVVAIKLQGLRREFETLFMNQGEYVQLFLTRVTSIVNQIRSCGEDLSEDTVVMKVLRSLTTKFDHVVAAIEESKDMSTYTLDELMGSLQVHEARLNRSEVRDDTKAFYTKGDSSRGQQQGRGRGQGNNRGRGGQGGRGRCKPNYNQSHSNQPKKDVECYYCHKKGHMQADCYKKQREEGQDVECYYCHKLGHVQADCYKKKREEGHASFVEKKSNQARLFMAKIDEESDVIQIWFLDSGCSNHMIGFKHLFGELDESYKKAVKLGDDKEMHVEGKRKIDVQTSSHNTRMLHDVYYIPQLSQNLLNIGQMMDSGCIIKFEGDNCRITDAATDQTLATIKKTQNNLFDMWLHLQFCNCRLQT